MPTGDLKRSRFFFPPPSPRLIITWLWRTQPLCSHIFLLRVIWFQLSLWTVNKLYRCYQEGMKHPVIKAVSSPDRTCTNVIWSLSVANFPQFRQETLTHWRLKICLKCFNNIFPLMMAFQCFFFSWHHTNLNYSVYLSAPCNFMCS